MAEGDKWADISKDQLQTIRNDMIEECATHLRCLRQDWSEDAAASVETLKR